MSSKTKTKIPKTFEEDLNTLKESIQKLKSTSEYKIRLIVDTKEKQKLKDLISSSAEFASLKSGDFWITLNGKLLFLFERKRFKDFCGSVVDGRMSSQGFKMDLMPISPHRAFYLFESDTNLSGDINSQVNQNNKEQIRISRLSIAGYLTKLHVHNRRATVRTMDMYETVLYMLYYVKWAYEYGHEYKTELDRFPVVDISYDPLKADLSTLFEMESINSCEIDNSSRDSKDARDVSDARDITDNNHVRDARDSKDSKNINDKKYGKYINSIKSTSDTKEEKKTNILSTIEKKYVASKKKKVKGVNNANTWYLACLLNIERMGQKAHAIMRAYPKFNYLFKFINSAERDKVIKKLTNIELETSNLIKKASDVKKRRITRVGENMATKLYEFISDGDYKSEEKKKKTKDDGSEQDDEDSDGSEDDDEDDSD